jgi:hypothetical protein
VKNSSFFKIIEGAGFAMYFFAPDLICCRFHGTHRFPFSSAAIE